MRKIVRQISVTLDYHDDGCVILSADCWGRAGEHTCYERYSPSTPAHRVFRAFSTWLQRIDQEETDSEILWQELQLPFDSIPADDV